jgi:hypothetical protein
MQPKLGFPIYLTTLPLFGQEEWDHLYIPAELPSEISIQRSFYPNRPGSSRRSHLEHGVDVHLTAYIAYAKWAMIIDAQPPPLLDLGWTASWKSCHIRMAGPPLANID